MILWESLKAVVLGLVEGATEFIPVSSTGHLILAGEFLQFSPSLAGLFEVVIQLGAILAVCWLYRQKLFDLARNIHKKPQQSFILKLFVAFLPAAVIGFAFHGAIKDYLFSPVVVAVMLVVGGIVMWLVEKLKPAPEIGQMEGISFKRAFFLGCFQALAIVPGTSRSGATIVGGLILRLDRKTAAEFSFFLAIPTMLAATAYDLYKSWAGVSLEDIILIAIGFVVSFISGLAAVKFFISYISRHDFVPFAIYRIIIGFLMLVVFF